MYFRTHFVGIWPQSALAATRAAKAYKEAFTPDSGSPRTQSHKKRFAARFVYSVFYY